MANPNAWEIMMGHLRLTGSPRPGTCYKMSKKDDVISDIESTKEQLSVLKNWIRVLEQKPDVKKQEAETEDKPTRDSAAPPETSAKQPQPDDGPRETPATGQAKPEEVDGQAKPEPDDGPRETPATGQAKPEEVVDGQAKPEPDDGPREETPVAGPAKPEEVVDGQAKPDDVVKTPPKPKKPAKKAASKKTTTKASTKKPQATKTRATRKKQAAKGAEPVPANTLEDELAEQLTPEEIDSFQIEKVDMERLTHKVCDLLVRCETDGMLQSELYKKLKLSARNGARLSLKLERMGMVTRVKLLEKQRWTYKLILKKTPVSTASLEDAPCLVCPVEQRCSLDGEISPRTCVFIEDWVITELKRTKPK